MITMVQRLALFVLSARERHLQFVRVSKDHPDVFSAHQGGCGLASQRPACSVEEAVLGHDIVVPSTACHCTPCLCRQSYGGNVPCACYWTNSSEPRAWDEDLLRACRFATIRSARVHVLRGRARRCYPPTYTWRFPRQKHLEPRWKSTTRSSSLGASGPIALTILRSSRPNRRASWGYRHPTLIHTVIVSDWLDLGGSHLRGSFLAFGSDRTTRPWPSATRSVGRGVC
jgi:hypothetical protein